MCKYCQPAVYQTIHAVTSREAVLKTAQQANGFLLISATTEQSKQYLPLVPQTPPKPVLSTPHSSPLQQRQQHVILVDQYYAHETRIDGRD